MPYPSKASIASKPASGKPASAQPTGSVKPGPQFSQGFDFNRPVNANATASVPINRVSSRPPEGDWRRDWEDKLSSLEKANLRLDPLNASISASERPICVAYSEGKCQFGAWCFFSHGHEHAAWGAAGKGNQGSKSKEVRVEPPKLDGVRGRVRNSLILL